MVNGFLLAKPRLYINKGSIRARSRFKIVIRFSVDVEIEYTELKAAKGDIGGQSTLEILNAIRIYLRCARFYY